MFIVITELKNWPAGETQKVSEHLTENDARETIRDMIYAGSSNPFWVIDTSTGAIL